MLALLVAAGLAILISAACSVMEAVLYSVPWSHIEHLRKLGRPSGRLLYRLRSDVDKPITAILTLNTIANTAGATIAGAAAAREFGSQYMGYFAAMFTLCILLFSEILPKTFGVACNRTLAPFIAGPLQLMVLAFTPVAWVTGLLSNLVRPSKKGPQTTEDDIRAIVSLTRRSGIIKPYEELAIKNILSLDQKLVKDIMTPRTVVFCLPADMTVAEARKDKDLQHYSRTPVHEPEDSEDIVGIVFRRDILRAVADDLDDKPLSELMRPVSFVVETLTLDRLLLKFLGAKIHLFVVLDEYGGVAGVVSLEDVLEEILGKEIVDESDEVADMRELAKRQRRSLTKLK